MMALPGAVAMLLWICSLIAKGCGADGDGSPTDSPDSAGRTEKQDPVEALPEYFHRSTPNLPGSASQKKVGQATKRWARMVSLQTAHKCETYFRCKRIFVSHLCAVYRETTLASLFAFMGPPF
jgi:hypothetical protein